MHKYMFCIIATIIFYFYSNSSVLAGPKVVIHDVTGQAKNFVVRIYCPDIVKGSHFIGYLGDVIDIDGCYRYLDINFYHSSKKFYGLTLKLPSDNSFYNHKQNSSEDISNSAPLNFAEPQCWRGNLMHTIKPSPALFPKNLPEAVIRTSPRVSKLDGFFHIHINMGQLFLPLLLANSQVNIPCLGSAARLVMGVRPLCSKWKGSLDTVPTGANVEDNDKHRGLTKDNFIFFICGAKKKILLRKKGYINKSYTIKPNSKKDLKVELTAISKSKKIRKKANYTDTFKVPDEMLKDEKSIIQGILAGVKKDKSSVKASKYAPCIGLECNNVNIGKKIHDPIKNKKEQEQRIIRRKMLENYFLNNRSKFKYENK